VDERNRSTNPLDHDSFLSYARANYSKASGGGRALSGLRLVLVGIVVLLTLWFLVIGVPAALAARDTGGLFVRWFAAIAIAYVGTWFIPGSAYIGRGLAALCAGSFVFAALANAHSSFRTPGAPTRRRRSPLPPPTPDLGRLVRFWIRSRSMLRASASLSTRTVETSPIPFELNDGRRPTMGISTS